MKTLAITALLCTLIAGAAAQQSSYSNPYNPINQLAGQLQLQNSSAMQNAEVQANAARAQAMIDQLNQQRMMQQMQQQQMNQLRMQQQTLNPYQYSTPAPMISTVPVYTPAPAPVWPY